MVYKRTLYRNLSLCLSLVKLRFRLLSNSLFSQKQPHINDINYSPFNSSKDFKKEKVTVVMTVDATLQADSDSLPWAHALESESFSSDDINVISIINKDEALWGTKGFVTAKVEEKQRRYPAAVFVLDEKGKAKSTWKLKESVGVIVLDKAGKIVKLNDGALKGEQINEFISAIKASL